ncbi:unnamed protein product [Blepharisma stoltei]|uniref:COPI associated protein n=1 Tax=Blepharisma stoltei TaxID=1481888 RepID=A0AAU9K8P6_9CILI|nr:unnamed protein product [Blepharisma stoltei]
MDYEALKAHQVAPPKQDFMIRILSFICGFGMLGLCAYNFWFFKVRVPIDIFLPVYYGLFGLMMMAAEIRSKCIETYARFLCETFGKGMFFVFAGTLCIRSTFIGQYGMAALCIGIGIFILCCRPVKQNTTASDPPESQFLA